MPRSFSRRTFLKTAAVSSFAVPGLVSGVNSRTFAADKFDVPVRVITRGPKHHWFGYYDKLEFDPTQRYVLSMEVDFEHRSPRPTDEIIIGMVDLQDNDRWIELGSSTAWGWQQGCMLQWLPGSKSKIIWNDRGKNGYVSHVMDVFTREKKTIDAPVYTLNPQGKSAVNADFRRINDVRPGYGYAGFSDPYADQLTSDETGIFRVNLETGKQDLIITLEQIAKLGTIPNEQPGIKHYFNHLLYNKSGSRFLFLHRWRYPNGKRLTRMITANEDGSDIRIIDDNGLTSHFDWRDDEHILAFSEHPAAGRRFYLFEDKVGGKIEPVGADVMKRDGHCTYLPGSEWILNDTYPDKNLQQSVFLHHVATGKNFTLTKFPAPKEYRGEWRCDTHPRFSPDGKWVVCDAPYEDQGRQLYLIDISNIVGS